MKNLIVANWKMNPATQKEAEEIFGAIKIGVKDTRSEIVICPPFIYLSELKGLPLGAQNVYFEEKGAFTGEVSSAMLKDLGVEYVIIGHSERRKYFNETDEIINKKIKKCLEDGLKVIFCIGETEDENTDGRKKEVLENQIKIGLRDATNYKLLTTNLVIAYEPVWAIGTGKSCGVEDAKKMKDFISKLLPGNRILYGGSVKSQNSESYLKEAGYNGLLVGGASLNPEEFIKIVKSAE